MWVDDGGIAWGDGFIVRAIRRGGRNLVSGEGNVVGQVEAPLDATLRRREWEGL